jgi:hypothetical protein
VGGAIIVRNPISWLISQFAPAADKSADAVPNADRFVCGTPHVWAEEQQQAAEWELADQDPSYGLSDGCVFFGKDQAWGRGGPPQTVIC